MNHRIAVGMAILLLLTGGLGSLPSGYADDILPLLQDDIDWSRHPSPIAVELRLPPTMVVNVPFEVTILAASKHPMNATIELRDTQLQLHERSWRVHLTNETTRITTLATASEEAVYRVVAFGQNNSLIIDEYALFIDLRDGTGSVSRADPRIDTSEDMGSGFVDNKTVEEPSVGTAAYCDVTFKIWWVVDNPNNQAYGSGYDDVRLRWARVELYDREPWPDAPDLVRSGYLDYTGYIQWTLQFDDGFNQGCIDPFVVVRSYAKPDDQSLVKGTVRNPDTQNVYSWTYHWNDNVGGIQQAWINVGGSNAGAAHILARMMEGYERATIFPNNYVVPEHATAFWKPGYTAATAYDADTYEILITGTSDAMNEWDPDVILHEYGHHALNAIYGHGGKAARPAGAGGPHAWGDCLNTGKALSEGWANFYQAWSQDLTGEHYGTPRDGNFQDATSTAPGIKYYLDSATPYGQCDSNEGLSGWQEGAFSEGVSGVFWDFHDAGWEDNHASEPGVDNLAYYGPYLQVALKDWKNFEGKHAQNMEEFHFAFDAEICCPSHDAVHGLLQDHDQYDFS